MQLPLSNVTDSSAELICFHSSSSSSSSSSSRFTKLVQRCTLMQMLFTSKGKAGIEGSNASKLETNLGSIKGVTQGGDPGEDLLHCLTKGLNSHVAHLEQEHPLNGSKGSCTCGQASNTVCQHWVACDSDETLQPDDLYGISSTGCMEHGTSSKESCASHHWHDITWCAQLGQDPCL